MVTAVGFDDDGFRFAGVFEHSCKQHSSIQTAGEIHTIPHSIKLGQAEGKLL